MFIKFKISIYNGALLALLFYANVAITMSNTISSEDPDPEANVKCDACLVVAKRFGKSFLDAEEKLKTTKLPEDVIAEAAEKVCDGDWSGYHTVDVDGVLHLGGPDTERNNPPKYNDDRMWQQRMQDFCDELLAEVPSDKRMYEAWTSDPLNLESMLCKGEATFSACSTQNYGLWPGDDDYDDLDYEDTDFDYPHDEF